MHLHEFSQIALQMGRLIFIWKSVSTSPSFTVRNSVTRNLSLQFSSPNNVFVFVLDFSVHLRCLYLNLLLLLTAVIITAKSIQLLKNKEPVEKKTKQGSFLIATLKRHKNWQLAATLTCPAPNMCSYADRSLLYLCRSRNKHWLLFPLRWLTAPTPRGPRERDSSEETRYESPFKFSPVSCTTLSSFG